MVHFHRLVSCIIKQFSNYFNPTSPFLAMSLKNYQPMIYFSQDYFTRTKFDGNASRLSSIPPSSDFRPFRMYFFMCIPLLDHNRSSRRVFCGKVVLLCSATAVGFPLSSDWCPFCNATNFHKKKMTQDYIFSSPRTKWL